MDEVVKTVSKCINVDDPVISINGNIESEEIIKNIEVLTLGDRRTTSSSIYKTSRTRLHDKRVGINQDIDKQVRILKGANNLLRVVNDRRLRDKVQVEMNYVHSNLHLLKGELDSINSSLDVYQRTDHHLPLIPLGMKQGNTVDFLVPFSDYILEHYSEDPRPYRHTIADMNRLRHKAIEVTRTEEGVRDLKEYLAALNVMDARFFPPGRTINIFFEWFDSLTGESRMQSSVAFEKGSMLFNLAALYSQLSVNESLTSVDSCELARSRLCAAAGLLKTLRDSFTNSPSLDMSPQVLNFFIPLMLTQSQECELAKLMLEAEDAASADQQDFERQADREMTLASEAAWLRDRYDQLKTSLTDPALPRDSVPTVWSTLIHLKSSVYSAESFFRCARCLQSLTRAPSPLDQSVSELLKDVEGRRKFMPGVGVPRRPRTFDDMLRLAKALIQEALSNIDDALGTSAACRIVREDKGGIQQLLIAKQELFRRHLAKMTVADSLGSSYVAFEVLGQAKEEPVPLESAADIPDYSDPFNKLGPVNIFSSRHFWSPPRRVRLEKDSNIGFGFSIRGDAPVLVVELDVGGPAEFAGIKAGDFIVTVNDQDTKWAKHEKVIEMVKQSGGTVNLRVVTPLDVDYLHPTPVKQPSASVSGSVKLGHLKMLPPQRGMSEPAMSNTLPVKGGRRWRTRLSGGSMFRMRRSSSKGRDLRDFEQEVKMN